jgi:polyhydroxyalkanoate synthesis regulator phasin
MGDSLFDQLRARGEGFLTEVSNNIMSNPAFVEILKKGVAAKEEVDRKVADGLRAFKAMAGADLKKLEERVDALERELASLKAPRARAAKPARKTARRK